mgnify:CR=1 FL=1
MSQQCAICGEFDGHQPYCGFAPNQGATSGTSPLRGLYAGSNAEYALGFEEGKASVNRDTQAVVAAIARAARTVAAAALAAEAWDDQTAVERAKFYWEQSGK